MSAIITSEPANAAPLVSSKPSVDPYRIGWRNVDRTRPDGTTERVQIPLTAADVLHPREGDVIVESSLNFKIRGYLAFLLEARLASDPTALVLSDTGVYWDDDPGLEHHSPDVAVIFGVRERRTNWKSFHVGEQGTRPRLIIEVVSPDTRENDVDKKFREYHRARVEFYVIVDDVGDRWRLLGYHYTPAKYVPLPLDDKGRLWLEPVGLWLGVKGDRVACYDGVTGEEIGDYQATVAQAAAANAARIAAEQRVRELEGLLEKKVAEPQP